MQLRLHEEILAKAHAAGALVEVQPASKRAGFLAIDVTTTPDDDLERLKPVLASFGRTHRAHVALRGIQSLLAARQGDFDGQPIAAVKEAPGILRAYLLDKVPDLVLWRHEHDHWNPYAIAHISVERALDGSQDLAFSARYWQAGKVHSDRFDVSPGQVAGRTAPQVVAAAGFALASPEIVAAHEEDLERFQELDAQVGLQLLGTGMADYADEWRREAGFGRRYMGETAKRMELDGRPARLVIDVHTEKHDSDDQEPAFHSDFWKDSNSRHRAPIHATLSCFDLRRHKHCLVNAGDVDVYQYNDDLDKVLVLPEADRKLIECLVGTSQHYRDVIEAKGEGVVALCSGPPGTGKTLTAEVQAERLHRPLYVVQSSQLGTNARELEERLQVVLARAARWKALLLIDEADVFIHERGNDLEQNAVVGVSLRLLEYHRGLLILATNREVIVDDAIISRCAAHIRYTQPTREARAQIWTVLARAAGLPLADGLATTMADEWDWTSGRDIKNALKLASYSRPGATLRAQDLEAVLPYIPRTRGERQ